jgi:hypothetical protein
MSVIPQTPRASGGLAPLGSALDQLGTLSGPQTPCLRTPPLTTNPGSDPDIVNISEIRWKLWMFMCSVCDFMDCHAFLEWSQVRDLILI